MTTVPVNSPVVPVPPATIVTDEVIVTQAFNDLINLVQKKQVISSAIDLVKSSMEIAETVVPSLTGDDKKQLVLDMLNKALTSANIPTNIKTDLQNVIPIASTLIDTFVAIR